ncbi:MAG: hypothetical protein ACRDS1_06515 [Pseudonocardiaceae bacterium]
MAERDVRLGGGVVVYLLTKPITEHDRRALGVRGTGLTAANQPQAPPELQAALTTITHHVDAYATLASPGRPKT